MATTETDEPQKAADDAPDAGASDAAAADAATEPEPAPESGDAPKAAKNRASRKAASESKPRAKREVVEEPAPAVSPMADNPAQQVMDRNTEFEQQRLADQQRRVELRTSGVSSEDVNEIERKEALARKG